MKPPGKKKTARQVADPTEENAQPERIEPAAAERTDDRTDIKRADQREAADTGQRSGSPSREEVITNAAQPVTNQDEQEKITNAGTGDIPLADK